MARICVAHGAADPQQLAAQIGYSRAGHRSAPITQCDPSRGPVRRQIADFALTWLTCGRTFPAAQKCRFGVGRIDSARLTAIMLLIYGWRRGPERVSGHVQETLAASGNLAVACEAAGDRAIPPYARLMTCANT
jgi:hypothetical protein